MQSKRQLDNQAGATEQIFANIYGLPGTAGSHVSVSTEFDRVTTPSCHFEGHCVLECDVQFVPVYQHSAECIAFVVSIQFFPLKL